MKKISFVIPCYCSTKTIGAVVEELTNSMKKENLLDYEIILVNDSSPENTFENIRQLCKEDEKIIGINLAKNFGQHGALMAGMGAAKGEIVVCLDDDGQTPADEAKKLIEKINQGYDVVYASYPKKRHSIFRNVGSKINSLMTEYLLDKPKNLHLSSYFAARRFVIEEILKYENAYPYVIGLVLRTTKHIANVEVSHREREEGSSGYTFRKLLALWINGFTAFSVKPLRLASLLGGFAAVAGVFVIAWIIYNKMTNPQAPLGWSSMVALLLLLGGMILFVLGMIGEYIGRIYISLNRAPQYVVRERIHYEKESEGVE